MNPPLPFTRCQLSPHTSTDLECSLSRQAPHFFFNFYWSIVDLQCCVSFSCTAKWINYTYIHSFLDSFPIEATTEYWVEFPEAPYSRAIQTALFSGGHRLKTYLWSSSSHWVSSCSILLRWHKTPRGSVWHEESNIFSIRDRLERKKNRV